MNSLKITVTFFVSLLILAALSSVVNAQKCSEVVHNATIVNGNVHLRSTTPRFTLKTLVRFRLTQGKSLAIVTPGTRVEILERAEVAGRYEWFRVRYCSKESLLTGWIYGGVVGNRQYIRVDKGVDLSSKSLDGSKMATGEMFHFSLNAFVKSAAAKTERVVDEPDPKTNPFLTLLLGALYLALFVAALFITRRFIFPNSHFYSFLTSLAFLLILGFLSSTQFSGLIGRVLAKNP